MTTLAYTAPRPEHRELVEWVTGHEPFLIEPTQKPIQYDGKYPFGEPALLPSVGCEAVFVSSGMGYEMRLTVIWFQHDYAFPLDPEVRSTAQSKQEQIDVIIGSNFTERARKRLDKVAATEEVREDFERTEDLRLCRWCNFKAVCRPDAVADATTADGPAAASLGS